MLVRGPLFGLLWWMVWMKLIDYQEESDAASADLGAAFADAFPSAALKLTVAVDEASEDIEVVAGYPTLATAALNDLKAVLP